MQILSSKMKNINPSKTKEMTQKARALKAEGRDIITLSQGEPDFATPEHVGAAAIQAILKGHTKYTDVPGVLTLRRAVVAKFARDNGLHFDTDQITVGVGAKQLLFNAFLATLDEGDEVLYPTPCWVSYPEMVKLAGGTPIEIKTKASDHFILQPDDLQKHITSKTKWLMINSPSNPTGTVYSREDLEALAKVLRANPDVWVLCDDIYEYLVYDDTEFFTLGQVAPDLMDRILTVNGVSKSFAMTGWRIGFAGGPKHLIKAMNTIQGQSTSHACSIAQYAAIAALNGSREDVLYFRSQFKQRRDYVVERVGRLPGLMSVNKPQGAFYVFIDCNRILGNKKYQGKTISNDIELAMCLLEYGGVALVPGTSFMAEGFLRLSYAASMEDLTEAMDRIENVLLDLTDV